MSKEQIGEMHQKSIDAAMKLTQMSMENFKKMMSVSAMPGNSQDAFATMQKAFGTAKDAFEQIAKASTAAFNNMGGAAGKGKSVKVE